MFISEVCSNPVINNAGITLSFPPIPGTEVEVECLAGFQLTGSSHITCAEGNVWEPRDSIPSCGECHEPSE